MKAEFNIPRFEVIYFNDADAIATSGCVGTYTCMGYDCPECPDMCNGAGICMIYDVRK